MRKYAVSKKIGTLPRSPVFFEAKFRKIKATYDRKCQNKRARRENFQETFLFSSWFTPFYQTKGPPPKLECLGRDAYSVVLEK